MRARELTHATRPEPRHRSTPHCPSGVSIPVGCGYVPRFRVALFFYREETVIQLYCMHFSLCALL
jgi:hypothetical protein